MIVLPDKYISLIRDSGHDSYWFITTLLYMIRMIWRWTLCSAWSSVPSFSFQVLQKLGKADETKDEQFEQCVQNFKRQEVRFQSQAIIHIMIT